MRIELRKMDPAIREECESLHVREDQKVYIASNADSLKTAEEYPEAARPFALYADGRMVGFAMFAFDEEYEDPEDRYWLWRFMIDRKEQGNGYGRAALEVILSYFRDQGANIVTLSTKASNERALGLYHQAGFKENGQMNGEEIVLKLVL